MNFDALRASLADRYRIERELGAGGMATVYLAEDLKHHRQVAIKVMHEELSAAIGGERFLREIETIARLQHPHILPLIDSDSTGGVLYYVAPYVRGETLRSLLEREGRLAPDRAAALALEIADALAYSHREGVVHRDIKPENILLQEGHAVLADFGVARALTAAGGATMTQAGFAVGTPAYMSPEQATASAVIDGKADIYALGCVLFEMLAGHPPFTGDNLQQVVAAHVTTPAPAIASVRSDTPRQLADLVAACLAKNPADRPDAAALVARLKEGGGGAPAPRPGGRVLALAAAALALLAAGGWWLLGRDGTSSTSITGEASQIAVMPLSAISDTSLARLGHDLVVTLSTTLDGVGDLHTVDASTLLLNTRDAPSPLPLAQAREIATRLGAGQCPHRDPHPRIRTGAGGRLALSGRRRHRDRPGQRPGARGGHLVAHRLPHVAGAATGLARRDTPVASPGWSHHLLLRGTAALPRRRATLPGARRGRGDRRVSPCVRARHQFRAGLSPL